jgi:hypothetical protein
LVALDRVRIADLGVVIGEAGGAAGPSLAEQVPALIERDLNGLKPGVVLRIQTDTSLAPLQSMLFVDQLVDVLKDRVIVHGKESYRASVARHPSDG